jgi:methylamine--corrinoid protein Co-methyltransferase
MIEQMPIVGGYVGSAEQAAVSSTATHLATFVLFRGSYHLDGPVHVRWGITTSRESLQVAGHTAAALDRNTDFLIANQYYPLAGPCTEMCLLETAAQSITDTASGRELASGVASAKGVATDQTTAMEARVMGEASIATTKINVKQANEILNAILEKYEGLYKTPPTPKRFQECYNVMSIKPTEEHLKVYEKAMNTLEKCGLPLEGIW